MPLTIRRVYVLANREVEIATDASAARQIYLHSCARRAGLELLQAVPGMSDEAILELIEQRIVESGVLIPILGGVLRGRGEIWTEAWADELVATLSTWSRRDALVTFQPFFHLAAMALLDVGAIVLDPVPARGGLTIAARGEEGV